MDNKTMPGRSYSPCADRRKWRALAICLLASVNAHAGLILTAGSAAVAPGGSGSIDVLLENTGPSVPVVDAFFFRFSTSNTFVTFTSADISTASPYIFAGNSLFGPIISTTPPPSGQLVDASDVADIGLGTAVGVGSTVGLGHILFDIAPGAPSGAAVIVLDASGTSLADAAGNSIPATLNNGLITITAANVPEPSMFPALVLVLLASIAFRRRQLRFTSL